MSSRYKRILQVVGFTLFTSIAIVAITSGINAAFTISFWGVFFFILLADWLKKD